MKPVDDRPVWSIVCFYVDKLERSQADWFGAKTMFDRAGFEEVARRKATRPVVRKPVRRRRVGR